MMNLIEFFSKNSRVNIKPGLFSVSRFSGSRNSENILILMLTNENRKLSNKNNFFLKTRPKTDGDTLNPRVKVNMMALLNPFSTTTRKL